MDHLRARLERLLIGDASVGALTLAVAVPLGISAWLLMGPGWVLSREMTWDLLFNLAGAWHLEQGHQAHVDFHDPLGVIAFQSTRFGLWMAGPTVRAFLMGQLLVLIGLAALAVYAACRRLPWLPAILFAWYGGLLVLVPKTLGDQVNAYSFAMSYNRWGWSALMSLLLIVFVERRHAGLTRPASQRDAAPPWIDPAVSGLVILFLFYLKFTYAVAAVAAVVFAVVAIAQVRRHWPYWVGMLVAVLVFVALPPSRPYLLDLRYALTSGYARTSLSHLIVFLDNRRELALQALGIWVLLGLWTRQYLRLETVLAGAVVTGLGLLVMSQNAQVRDMPVGVVIFLMAYTAVCRLHRDTGPWALRSLTVVLTGLVLSLVLAIVSQSATLVAYARAASRTRETLRVERTNLRGLAVPTDPAMVEAPESLPHEFLNPFPTPARDPVTQFQYVESILEAAAYLREVGADMRRILVLDQVNPMPFVLGAPSPRGGPLWLWAETPPRPATAVLGDVEVLLLPRQATDPSSTLFVLHTYGDYIGTHFLVRRETPRWTILMRAEPPVPPGS